MKRKGILFFLLFSILLTACQKEEEVYVSEREDKEVETVFDRIEKSQNTEEPIEEETPTEVEEETVVDQETEETQEEPQEENIETDVDNQETIEANDTVQVAVQILNLRSLPTTDSMIVLTLEQGVNLEVIENQGDWLYVQLQDGTLGYVSGELVELVE